MGLKKFSDFANNKIEEACGKSHDKKETKPKESSKKSTKHVVEEVKESVQPKVEQPKTNWKCKRTNNIVEFNEIIKPSESFKYLKESSNDHGNLHYVLSEQPNNSVSVFRYNQNEGVNMKEFAESLLLHYKKNDILNKVLENSSVDGNEHFAVFKNLPDEKFINIVKKDLVNLLKNK